MPAYVPDPDLLPATVVEHLGYWVAEAYADIEARILSRLRAVLSEGLEAGDLQDRAAEVQRIRQEADRLLARMSPQLAERVIEYATQMGTAAAASSLTAALGPLQFGATAAVTALAFDLSSRFEVLRERILRYPQDAYQRAVAQTVPLTLAGIQTSLATQRLTVSRLLAQGIDGFVDRSDRAWKIGTYAEMATRTATLRAWRTASVATMQSVGVGLVSVVVGNTACSACGRWAGKVLSTDGTLPGVHQMQHATEDRDVPVHVDGTLAEAIAAGFQHPNCRCALVAYMPGLSALGMDTVYDPVREAELVRLRELERGVRAAKRELAAGIPGAQADVRAGQKAIREHLAATGLSRQSYREQLWFTDGRATVRAATPRTTKERQDALGIDFGGDKLQEHEVAFLEKFTQANTIRWIPRDVETRRPTNDFVWVNRGGIEVELKSVRSPGYSSIKNVIHGAVGRAAAQGVVKDTFIVDIGLSELSEKLAGQLAKYNERTTSTPISRLFIFTRGRLREIDVQARK